MAYDSTLKKAQEQSKGTIIMTYWHVSDGLWQYLKESPGAIQGTIQDYCVSVMALWQSLKKAQEQSKGTIQDYWRVSDGIMTVP